jgi:hypothetical protein
MAALVLPIAASTRQLAASLRTLPQPQNQPGPDTAAPQQHSLSLGVGTDLVAWYCPLHGTATRCPWGYMGCDLPPDMSAPQITGWIKAKYAND